MKTWPLFLSFFVALVLSFGLGLSSYLKVSEKDKAKLIKESLKLNTSYSVSDFEERLSNLKRKALYSYFSGNLSSPIEALFLFSQGELEKAFFKDEKEEIDLYNKAEFALKTKRQDSSFLFFKGKKPVVSLSYPLGEGEDMVVFLKKSSFFKLKTYDKNLHENRAVETFVFNKKKDVIFHERKASVFKQLDKSSPLYFLDIKKSKQLKTKNKSGLNFYYAKALKDTNLILVSKTVEKKTIISFFSSSFFLILLFFGILGSLFFSFRGFYYLLQAFDFLKRSLVFFSKSGFFMPQEGKNPWLYFYESRIFFKKEKIGEKKKELEIRSQFSDIVKYELESLNLENLKVEEIYDYDLKVYGFERFCHIMLKELLKNAVEAMGSLSKPRLEIQAKKVEDFFVFSIRDFGEGVKDKDRMFELYYSDKGSLGVGLNLVESIIKANRGSIDVSSPEGGGVRVTVAIPLSCFLKFEQNYEELLR